jgi:DNA-binding transcriptional ArsR family regulator
MDATAYRLLTPRRLEILRLVWHDERAAGDVAAELPVSFAAVSQQLRLLREAGLVSVRPAGKQRFYLARPSGLGPLAAHYEQLWGRSLARLRELAEDLERQEDDKDG